jgi:DNA repair exonuclease SbcCD ATPase subunit
MINDISTLTLAARSRRRELDGLWGEARSVLLRGKEIQEEIVVLTETISDLEKVTLLLNSLGEQRQLQAQAVIEELVTRGLQTIFDDTLSFHIVQSTRAKAATVEFLIRKTLSDSVLETPVLEGQGGGLSATIGFLLRLVVMLLGTGTSEENILVLDESFAHVSDEYLPALGEFLREIVDKTGVQIIMVTHQPQFEEYADRVYRFSQTNGRTLVEGA